MEYSEYPFFSPSNNIANIENPFLLQKVVKILIERTIIIAGKELNDIKN